MEKLHQTVLNRCRSKLIKDLNVEVVMKYIQEKELFDDVTIRDINEQTTTTAKISHLIDQIKQSNKDTYTRFKQCLIEAQREDLKIMLEKEENLSAGMNTPHHEKLHQTVLNRCLTNLTQDLYVQDVIEYVQEKGLFDCETIRDIKDQPTSTKAISLLIDQLKQRDQYTYEKFKECLILSNHADLKNILEKEEKKLLQK
ncbi:hypothetical protein ACJMK2_001511 [Sinanodonta woodiana]|uniref:CARD domain-containing protein n=1 Tax=Sinanodonta woodiana TaxID=1069815 RepID=A0ABD3XUQ5_SINWO